MSDAASVAVGNLPPLIVNDGRPTDPDLMAAYREKEINRLLDHLDWHDQMRSSKVNVAWLRASFSIYDTRPGADQCHCGRSVHVYGDGFTRDMCEECSDYRCDVSASCPVENQAEPEGGRT